MKTEHEEAFRELKEWCNRYDAYLHPDDDCIYIVFTSNDPSDHLLSYRASMISGATNCVTRDLEEEI